MGDLNETDGKVVNFLFFLNLITSKLNTVFVFVF